jgi:outer membrane protein OmpA-like peptidoglycan-associated protein
MLGRQRTPLGAARESRVMRAYARPPVRHRPAAACRPVGADLHPRRRPLDAAAVLQLQRTAGNRAVGIEIGEVTVEPVCRSYARGERARAASPAGVLDVDVSLAGGHGIESAAGDSVVVADFPIGSAELRPSTGAQLRSSWIGILERQSGVKYEIVGYSDCAGEGSRNSALRRARAHAVAGLFPRTAARATAIGGAPVTDYAVDNGTPEHRALNRSVIIRLRPSTPPPPAPTPEPEQPHVVIPRREPPTRGCRRPWREMLSVAWPAAKMMVEKALEMAYTGKGSVNTYLLERYFGPDALTNIVPIRYGYQSILSKWFDWDPNFECHEQAEARCPSTDRAHGHPRLRHEAGRMAVHPDALRQRARLHRGLPPLDRQPAEAVGDRRARAQPPPRQHP